MRLKLLTFIVFLLAVQTAEATTYYVTKAGSDSNTCASAQNISTPKLTIAGGLSCVSTSLGAGAGHTVQVSAGLYAEKIGPTFPSGTSWSAPFTLRAKPGDVVTVKASANNQNVQIYQPINQAFYSIIEGFVFDGSNITSSNVTGSLILGSCCDAPKYFRVKSNEFINNYASAMFISQYSDHIEILNNKIHGGTFACSTGNAATCGGSTYPIYIPANTSLIEGNEFYDFPGYAIHMYSGNPEKPHHNVIRNNYIHNTGVGVGILISWGDSNSAYNNIIHHCFHGIDIDFGATNTKIYNNTYWANAQYGLSIGSASTTLVKNNIFWQDASGSINNTSGTTTLSNNSTTDPKFVNAAGGDFRLQSTSAAINAGVALSDPSGVFPGISTDYSGVPRPQGSAWDIGSYEYTSGTPPPSNLTISSSVSGSSNVGATYLSILSATGGVSPYTWSISAGSLPPGVSLISSTSRITGNPSQIGKSTFTVKVTDSQNSTAIQSASISVGPGAGCTVITAWNLIEPLLFGGVR